MHYEKISLTFLDVVIIIIIIIIIIIMLTFTPILNKTLTFLKLQTIYTDLSR